MFTEELTETLMRDREAARKALANYKASLGGAIVISSLSDDEEAERDHRASLAQVESAMRVLWMEN